MGANFQPMGHVYVMTNMLDYGMDPQQAIDSPRVFFEDGKLESRTACRPPSTTASQALGHPVMARRPLGWRPGVWFDRANGVLIGASDARKDGMAVGY